MISVCGHRALHRAPRPHELCRTMHVDVYPALCGFRYVPSGDIELCVRPGKIHRCNKAVGKEESERCPVCFDYRVPEDDPLVVCEVCEIFAHRVRVRLMRLPVPSMYCCCCCLVSSFLIMLRGRLLRQTGRGVDRCRCTLSPPLCASPRSLPSCVYSDFRGVCRISTAPMTITNILEQAVALRA